MYNLKWEGSSGLLRGKTAQVEAEAIQEVANEAVEVATEAAIATRIELS